MVSYQDTLLSLLRRNEEENSRLRQHARQNSNGIDSDDIVSSATPGLTPTSDSTSSAASVSTATPHSGSRSGFDYVQSMLPSAPESASRSDPDEPLYSHGPGYTFFSNSSFSPVPSPDRRRNRATAVPLPVAAQPAQHVTTSAMANSRCRHDGQRTSSYQPEAAASAALGQVEGQGQGQYVPYAMAYASVSSSSPRSVTGRRRHQTIYHRTGNLSEGTSSLEHLHSRPGPTPQMDLTLLPRRYPSPVLAQAQGQIQSPGSSTRTMTTTKLSPPRDQHPPMTRAETVRFLKQRADERRCGARHRRGRGGGDDNNRDAACLGPHPGKMEEGYGGGVGEGVDATKRLEVVSGAGVGGDMTARKIAAAEEKKGCPGACEDGSERAARPLIVNGSPSPPLLLPHPARTILIVNGSNSLPASNRGQDKSGRGRRHGGTSAAVENGGPGRSVDSTGDVASVASRDEGSGAVQPTYSAPPRRRHQQHDSYYNHVSFSLPRLPSAATTTAISGARPSVLPTRPQAVGPSSPSLFNITNVAPRFPLEPSPHSRMNPRPRSSKQTPGPPSDVPFRPPPGLGFSSGATTAISSATAAGAATHFSSEVLLSGGREANSAHEQTATTTIRGVTPTDSTTTMRTRMTRMMRPVGTPVVSTQTYLLLLGSYPEPEDDESTFLSREVAHRGKFGAVGDGPIGGRVRGR